MKRYNGYFWGAADTTHSTLIDTECFFSSVKNFIWRKKSRGREKVKPIPVKSRNHSGSGNNFFEIVLQYNNTVVSMLTLEILFAVLRILRIVVLF